MKKVLVFCLITVMAVSMSFSALAVGGFLESPSGNLAPEVEDVTSGNGVEVEMSVTPYTDREDLAPEKKVEIEAAYAEIAADKDITKLNDGIADKAEAAGVEPEKLAVSDLFDLDAAAIGAEDAEGPFTVKLKSDNLDNFVCLIHRENGVWVVVENAAVEGDVLTFTVDSFSPFAIVTESIPDAPQTGSFDYIWIFAAVAVVSGAAFIFCFKKSRKQTA